MSNLDPQGSKQSQECKEVAEIVRLLDAPDNYAQMNTRSLVPLVVHGFRNGLVAESRKALEGLTRLTALAEKHLPPKDGRLVELYDITAQRSEDAKIFNGALALRKKQLELDMTTEGQRKALYGLSSIYGHLEQFDKAHQYLNQVVDNIREDQGSLLNPAILKPLGLKLLLARMEKNGELQRKAFGDFFLTLERLPCDDEQTVKALLDLRNIFLRTGMSEQCSVVTNSALKVAEKFDCPIKLKEELYTAHRDSLAIVGDFSTAIVWNEKLMELELESHSNLDMYDLKRTQIDLLESSGKPDASLSLLRQTVAQARKELAEDDLTRVRLEASLCINGIGAADKELATNGFEEFDRLVKYNLPDELYEALDPSSDIDLKELANALRRSDSKERFFFSNLMDRYIVTKSYYDLAIRKNTQDAINSIEHLFSLKPSRAFESRSKEVFIKLFLADMYLHESYTEKADSIVTSCIESYQDSPGSVHAGHAQALRLQAKILSQQQDLDGARELFESCIDKLNKLPNKQLSRHLEQAHVDFGVFLLESINEAEAAISEFGKALTIVEHLGRSDTQAGLFLNSKLAEAYESLGDMEKAEQHRGEAHKIQHFRLFEGDLDDDDLGFID